MTIEQLEEVKRQIPLIKQLLDTDVTITILADSKVQYVEHAKGFHMTNEPGMILPSDDPAYEVFKTKKPRYYEIPKEMFGVNIFGKYTPYFDKNGEFLCIIVTSFSMEKEIVLMELAESISSSLEETAAVVASYTEEVKKLSDSVITLNEMVENVEKGTNSISSLVKEIKANAARSKILALNATIEAARSGEAGRGFAIVAKEMGILANASNASSQKIDASLMEMFKHLKLISQDIEKVNTVVLNQSNSIEDISTAVEVIANESQQMFSMTTSKKDL